VAVDFDDDAARPEWNPDELRHVRVVTAALEEQAPDRAVLGDEVTAALEDLQADYQTALLLSAVEGYSYDEIAEFTNAPLGTVRSRIHRARKQLTGRLNNYARHEGYIRSAA